MAGISLFVREEKADGRTKVVFPYAALYYYWMWVALIVGLVWFLDFAAIPVWIIALTWLLLIGLGVPYWATTSRIKKIMKAKSVSATGSKYSFANPLTYEWSD